MMDIYCKCKHCDEEFLVDTDDLLLQLTIRHDTRVFGICPYCHKSQNDNSIIESINKNEKPLSFAEWISVHEESSIESAEHLIKSMQNTPYHDGDCIDYPQTCHLCIMEDFLKEYREYTLKFYKNKKEEQV